MTDARFSPLTSRESVVALIDFQSQMFLGVGAPERHIVLNNAVTLARAAVLFDVPVILTTLRAKGFSGDLLPEIQAVFPGEESISRSTMNSWEDKNFRSAATNFGRQKIIIAGLWTEAGVYFPAIDAISEGYDVHVPTDACGDITAEAHERAIQRAVQAGVIPMTALQVMFEWQRDGGREETHDGCMEILRVHAARSLGTRHPKTIAVDRVDERPTDSI
jgi:nicotinamidase-related amidase